MNRRLRLVRMLAVSAVALVGLTACGPGGGGDADPTVAPPVVEHPTPATTPTPTGPQPEFVVLTAHSISVGDSTERDILDIPFTTDLATAASQLTAVIGRPTITPVPATGCNAASSVYDWGGLQLAFDPYLTDIGGTQFVATVTATHTTGGLELDAPYNQRVGMSLTDVLAHVPGSVSGDRGEGHIEALLDPQESGLWGVVVTFTAGVADGFHAPGVYLFGHGSCEAGT